MRFRKKKFRRSFKTSSSALKFFLIFILLTFSFGIYQFLASDILKNLCIELPSAIINISEANVNIPEITISEPKINNVSNFSGEAHSLSEAQSLEKPLEEVQAPLSSLSPTDQKELGMSKDRIFQLVEAGVATGIMAAVMIFLAGKSP